MDEKPFSCPKCGYADLQFHAACPECGRPFMRDYADTQIHPRDPDLTGICTVKFWARILLVRWAESSLACLHRSVFSKMQLPGFSLLLHRLSGTLCFFPEGSSVASTS